MIEIVLPSNIAEGRVALVGIGHELRGDDAAGLWVVRALTPCDSRLVIEAGSVPENVTGYLRRFQPQTVILIDAVQMNAAAGAVHVIDVHTATGLGASTHSLPLHVLADYWRHELGCEVLLIGIQPAQNGIGRSLSPAVEQAVNEIAEKINAGCVG